MDIDLARDVVRAAFRSSSELSGLLPVLKERCNSPDEYKDYARAVATAIAGIMTAVMDKAIAVYPELEAEIDTAIKATGRYR